LGLAQAAADYEARIRQLEDLLSAAAGGGGGGDGGRDMLVMALREAQQALAAERRAARAVGALAPGRCVCLATGGKPPRVDALWQSLSYTVGMPASTSATSLRRAWQCGSSGQSARIAVRDQRRAECELMMRHLWP